MNKFPLRIKSRNFTRIQPSQNDSSKYGIEKFSALAGILLIIFVFTAGCGYIDKSEPFLIKINNEGTVSWVKITGNIDPSAVLELQNGDIIYSDSGLSHRLTRVSPAGKIIWSKDYLAQNSGHYTNRFFTLLPDSAGGIKAVSAMGTVIGIDDSGNQITDNFRNNLKPGTNIKAALKTSDGGYLFAGTGAIGPWTCNFIRTDAKGTIKGEREYPEIKCYHQITLHEISGQTGYFTGPVELTTENGTYVGTLRIDRAGNVLSTTSIAPASGKISVSPVYADGEGYYFGFSIDTGAVGSFQNAQDIPQYYQNYSGTSSLVFLDKEGIVTDVLETSPGGIFFDVNNREYIFFYEAEKGEAVYLRMVKSLPDGTISRDSPILTLPAKFSSSESLKSISIHGVIPTSDGGFLIVGHIVKMVMN